MNRVAQGLAAGVWFWVGVAAGLLFERRRPFGSAYFQREAELAWQLKGDLGHDEHDDRRGLPAPEASDRDAQLTEDLHLRHTHVKSIAAGRLASPAPGAKSPEWLQRRRAVNAAQAALRRIDDSIELERAKHATAAAAVLDAGLAELAAAFARLVAGMSLPSDSDRDRTGEGQDSHACHCSGMSETVLAAALLKDGLFKPADRLQDRAGDQLGPHDPVATADLVEVGQQLPGDDEFLGGVDFVEPAASSVHGDLPASRDGEARVGRSSASDADLDADDHARRSKLHPQGPQVPDLIVVHTRAGRLSSLLVDGKLFPWRLADRGVPDIGVGPRSMTVTLDMFAREIRVVDERGVTTTSGGAAGATSTARPGSGGAR